jgi:hypothetical protein
MLVRISNGLYEYFIIYLVIYLVILWCACLSLMLYAIL